MNSLVIAFSVLFGAASVLAHGYVDVAVVGGTEWSGYLPYSDPYYNPVPERIFRPLPGNGPTTDLSLIDVQCNGYEGSGSSPAPLMATAAAGSDVSLHWTLWPDSHLGPVITYMAACEGACTSYVPGTEPVWFKVQEGGLDNGVWADEIFMNNENYTLTIPANLKAGGYIVRHEIIALHSASTYPGAQVYPSCFQVTVTGSGTATPTSNYLVSFPGAYTSDTPGIIFDIYNGPDTYPIPGPAVWTG